MLALLSVFTPTSLRLHPVRRARSRRSRNGNKRNLAIETRRRSPRESTELPRIYAFETTNVERLSNVCEDVIANESLLACLENLRG